MIATFIVAGLLLLFLGGEFLVRGAARLATRVGVSSLVIGLTVVGFGTSTPEMVTSVQAALAGSSGIAIGNIVGSNISNCLLVLGHSALIYPISVDSAALKRDGVVMLLVTAGFVYICFAMPLNRTIGVASLFLLVGYVNFVIWSERRSQRHGAIRGKADALNAADPQIIPETRKPSIGLSLVLCVTGLALLIAGATFLVEGASVLARSLGLSEAVIGLTIVAVGTSLPELVTSVVAAFKRQDDIAFGNIVGSNIYNIIGIGGVTGLIAPLSVPERIAQIDNLVMLAATLLLVLVAWSGFKIARREGALLLAVYGVYIFAVWR